MLSSVDEFNTTALDRGGTNEELTPLKSVPTEGGGAFMPLKSAAKKSAFRPGLFSAGLRPSSQSAKLALKAFDD
jgi:hypothetical protein